MRRETKFRAWDNVEMKMYYTGEEELIHFYFDSSGIVAERYFESEECTPEGDKFKAMESEKLEHLIYLQYTGLKDRNGKEIYEGDIIRVVLVDGEEIFKVHYETNRARYCFEDENGDDWGFAHSNEMEVIGNIYKNPELLNA